MAKRLSCRRNGDAPTFLSLFSGCGGLDLGFVNAGFRCKGAFDTDVGALAVHKANIPSQTFEWDLSSGRLPDGVPNVDVILSGSPCQGFSTIGKRRLDDLRNTLLLATAKIAVSIRPRVVVAENVPGVEFGSHRKYWIALVELLQNAGYVCKTLQLAASDFGVAQMRRRLFLLAVAQGSPTQIRPNPASQKTLADVLSDLSSPDSQVSNHEPQPLREDTEHFQIARRIKPGQKLCNVRVSERAVHTWDIPEVFGEVSPSERVVLNAVLRLRRRERLRKLGDADPVLRSSVQREVGFRPHNAIESLLVKNYLRKVGHRIDLRHTFNGKYRRLAWDALSFTVDTSFGNPKNFLHPDLQRGLTVREAARIQGFPDTFKFSGTLHDQFKFVGNAVPPPMAEALATQISALLKR
jgi:DNA (cytosine-5)-methyltransferase 1